MTKKAIVLIAEGFEEVETVTPITYLRRAGIDVTTASIANSLIVSGARGVKITADIYLEELLMRKDSFDVVIIPGGLKGAENLSACERTGAFLKQMSATGKLVCAICASPALVLSPLGLLTGKNFTCYPDFEKKVTDGTWQNERVVTDGNLITSRAAGTAGEFSIAIIEKLLGKETAEKIAESVLV